MKKLFGILAIAALSLAAFGQFTPPPHQQLALPANFLLGHATLLATNVGTLGFAPAFPIVGNNPVVLYMDWGATNGTTGDSNIGIAFQYSADGVKWMGPAATLPTAPALIYHTMAGPGAGKQQYQHVFNADPTTGFKMFTITNLTDIRFVRIAWLSNQACTAGQDGASNNYVLTNCWWIQRQN